MNSRVDSLPLQQSNNWLEKLARKRTFGFLWQIDNAHIVIRENGIDYEFGDANKSDSVLINVYDLKFYSMVAIYGTIGAGEAYMAGYWDCDDLVKLIQIFARNLYQVQSMDESAINVLKWIDKINNRFSRNSITGSSCNISRHYDLGNDLFEVFLDQRMMYSAAIYENEQQSLKTASENKLTAIAEKLQLTADDHLLEIGTGWGGLAIFMAQNYGCQVTTTTISNQQYQYAKQKIKQAGLEDRINLLKKDYRHLDGQFDKLVSVEMIEAVGHDYLPRYFKTCNDRLKPDGKMLLQAITIPEQRYWQAIKQVDFIQKYIFPGGCLPSIEIIMQNVGKQTQLQLRDFADMTHSYALTLAAWRGKFRSNLPQVRNQGYDESFIRMWEFYLCYCEAGFRANSIGTAQLLFQKQ